MDTEAGETPELRPIKGGWAAHGKGWAVHGTTREEALEAFARAVIRHREIDALPYWYERREQGAG